MNRSIHSLILLLSWVGFTTGPIALAQTSESRSTPTPSSQPTYARASDIPVEVFFRPPQNARMELSPDGRKLAALLPRNGRINLGILDLAKRTSVLITNFRNVDVNEFQWLSNSRLYLTTADFREATGNLYLLGRYAVNIDGTELRNLWRPTQRAGGTGTGVSGNATEFNVLALAPDASGDVIVEMNERNSAYVDVYRYNTLTGEYRLLTFDTPGNVIRWVLDRDLVPRIVVRMEERTDPAKLRAITTWHRASAKDPWELIAREEDRESRGISPIGFDYDNKTLYVSRGRAHPRAAIYKFDVANRKLGEKLVEHPLIDIRSGLVFSSTKKALVGIQFSADYPGAAWFDEEFARLQLQIDKALPDRFNTLSFARDSDRFVLIDSESGSFAGAYYLLDRETQRFERVAQKRPWLPAALMGERKFLQYTARDGRRIPAWLTLPKDRPQTPLPLIVHIHGGPWVRVYHGGGWDGDPIAQFFASRGYAVLEPEPRGSTGFGHAHAYAGYKQLGLTMQDDITDGALHLVEQGIIDMSKMCLFGASYGGYATLQGLVKDPSLWRCGNAYVAVTDLELWQTIRHSDTARRSDFLETDFKRMVGDKDADREQFTRTSPLKNVDKIVAPIMLTMGGADQRVPLKHGSAFYDAMTKAGKSLDYKVYADEAHGFNKPENVFDFYRRSEAFFAKHLQ